MASVGGHGALAVGHPAEDGEAGVKDGQAQHEEGDRKGDDGIGFEQPLDGYHRQDEAQEGGAGVSHEDLGRVQVIGKKADASAGQGGHEEGYLRFGHREGDDQHGHGADGGHAAGQPVQSVDEVDRVGDAHDPDHGDGDGQPAQRPVGVTAEDVGVGEDVDPVAHEHGDEGGQDLDQEFRHGGQGVDVVEDAQDDDDHSPQEHPPERGGQGDKDQGAEDKAEEDGQSPHPGDGVVVHPAVVPGHVHRTDLKGQGADHRRGDKGHHSGGEQRGGHRADYREFNRRQHEAVPRLQLIWSGQRATKPTFL